MANKGGRGGPSKASGAPSLKHSNMFKLHHRPSSTVVKALFAVQPTSVVWSDPPEAAAQATLSWQKTNLCVQSSKGKRRQLTPQWCHPTLKAGPSRYGWRSLHKHPNSVKLDRQQLMTKCSWKVGCCKEKRLHRSFVWSLRVAKKPMCLL